MSVARRAAQYLPANQGLPEKPLAAANDNPQKFLERKPLELGTKAGREMVLFALVKLAKSCFGTHAVGLIMPGDGEGKQ